MSCQQSVLLLKLARLSHVVSTACVIARQLNQIADLSGNCDVTILVFVMHYNNVFLKVIK